ncbi:high-affinity nicotinic acid transporter [Verticillium alfalfae VaMs.102]|uniref:High-affinity nicotinic acid transporter n=1 Tax=Verticillium alfalfae (strain VaMs.102 / ATCC MYA-4576 / FGSC 10136) TaxID=526221 RepID=C9S6Z8_VERA1|nr:high-affinity nicotinic acid transporter [Verticillium alfalfae VaMs.102]EEY14609.1 high-affinity nicotinic acid transporter [Verticillium alfalfae VaMs.102]
MASEKVSETMPVPPSENTNLEVTKSALMTIDDHEKGGSICEEPSNEIYVDPLLEKRVLRRLDYRFAPLFCALYFMAYLDRSNIGNAYIAGMRDELGLSGAQFSTAVSVFFATYVAFMVPFVLALKKLKTHRAIAVMAFAWSIVTIGTAFIKSYSGLLACRILLGVCESGFFPCISLYITMVYNRHEQGLRFSYLFAATAFSGMFGGLVATGITKIGNTGGLQSWSWLYIIEGLISLTVVPWAWFGLPEYPAKARWWTPEQRDTMERRELKRQEYMGTETFEWSQVFSALQDWRLYTGALIQFFQDVILYGFSSFLPSILRDGLGFSRLEAQYLSVPVYLLGGISFFVAAMLGDRYGLRGSILLFLDIFAVAGYAILLSVSNSSVRYFACFLIALPLYCGPGLNEMWIVNNTTPHYRRATALGISQAVGNVAGVVAGQVYRKGAVHAGPLVESGVCSDLHGPHLSADCTLQDGKQQEGPDLQGGACR